MKAVTPVLLVCAAVLAGCGGNAQTASPPRSHLGDHRPGTTPVVLRTGQTATRLELRAAFPADTREVWVRADCSGGGQELLEVTFSGVALSSAGFGCGRAGSGGSVSLGQDRGELDGGVHDITVTAPEGATWSVAIDAGGPPST